jgi:hypothetical protein
LSELQNQLLREAEDSRFERSVRGDRACCDRTLREIEDGRYTRQEMMQFFAPPPRGGGLSWEGFTSQLRIWLKGSSFKPIPEERLRAIQYYNALINEAGISNQGQFQRIQQLMKQAAERSAAVASLGAAAIKVYEADSKRRTLLRAAAALLAAERFRLENRRLPTGWNELMPRFFTTVPIDPYDDCPLRWKATPQGFILYSVWLNRVDDGGKIRFEGNSAPQDFGIQYWDVPFRRQPPVPRQENPETP